MSVEDEGTDPEARDFALNFLVLIISYGFATAVTMVVLVRATIVSTGEYGLLEGVYVFLTADSNGGIAILSGFVGTVRGVLVEAGLPGILGYPAEAQVAIISGILALPWVIYYVKKTQFDWRVDSE